MRLTSVVLPLPVAPMMASVWPLVYLEADMLQLVRRRVRIAEGDIAELDRAGPAAALSSRPRDDVRLRVQHLVDALCRDLRLRQRA